MVIYCCLMELYRDLMDYKWDIASGNLSQFAIENGHRNSQFSNEQW